MEKTNNLFRRMFLVAITCFMLVVSIFAFMPKKENSVYADETDVSYTFNGSNVFIPLTLNMYVGFDSQMVDGFVNFTVSITNGSYSFKDMYFYALGGFRNVYSFDLTDIVDIPIIADGVIHMQMWTLHDVSITYSYRWYNMYSCDTDFNYDITSIEIGYKQFNNGTADFNSHFVSYIDTNGKTFNIILNAFTTPLPAYLDSRVYYLSNAFLSNDLYNSGFLSGYDNGYNVGNEDGYSNGLSVGTSNGYTIGYNNGYAVGVESANNYTFLSLIGSVIDAPIKAFTGLFNFEILGTNLTAFITALLTLAIVIVVVKFAIGKF